MAGTMLRLVRLALVIVVIVLLQTALFPHLRLAGAAPDLGVVAVAALAYREGPEAGALFGFCAGIAVDLFLETPLGLSALAWALTGYVVGVLQGGLIRSSYWVAPVVGGLAGLFSGLVFITVGGLLGEEDLLTVHSLKLVLISSLYDALLAPIVFPAVGRLARKPARARTGVGGGGWDS